MFIIIFDKVLRFLAVLLLLLLISTGTIDTLLFSNNVCCCHGWIHQPVHHHHRHGDPMKQQKQQQGLMMLKTASSLSTSSFLFVPSWPFRRKRQHSYYPPLRQSGTAMSLSSSNTIENNNNDNNTSTIPPNTTTSTDTTTNTDTNTTTADITDKLRGLYPPNDWKIIRNGTLDVDETHSISYQVYGSNISSCNDSDDNEDGPKQQQHSKSNKKSTKKLIGLFLHGGPGAGCFPNHVRFFDPNLYDQIVLVDQRGCGQSQPTASLINQTLSNLIDDCEKLKKHLRLKYWDCVLGGSWGTTVAIAYAQQYPNSIKALILRGICLFRSEEIDWLFANNGGAAKLYPTQYEIFCNSVGLVSSSNSSSPSREALNKYCQRFWFPSSSKQTNINETQQRIMETARSWMQWEFYNSIAYKIPPTTSTSTSSNNNNNSSNPNEAMNAIREWKPQSLEVVICNSNSSNPSDNNTEWASIQKRFRRNISIGYDDISSSKSNSNIQEDDMPPPLSSSPTMKMNQQQQLKLPVQAMLTCYYSTYNKYCTNYNDLLDSNRIQNLTMKIPYIIAIQGGLDGICPPDSALDLFDAYYANHNNGTTTGKKGGGMMELRIPVNAGHSMYDPLITNEIIQATDRIADLLT